MARAHLNLILALKQPPPKIEKTSNLNTLQLLNAIQAKVIQVTLRKLLFVGTTVNNI
ncbi:unnamed protein product [Spirodela intermedia]|uniref:Uncharacterized protein n=1 Tax=Spirodela intermedia TaxID=51605 RepID=A0A7I8JL47_SPIIN|nr:unnamed protein product [Spirodela intermedia]CAA6670505.1 unnamed protein product [Spirodela intermedia]